MKLDPRRRLARIRTKYGMTNDIILARVINEVEKWKGKYSPSLAYTSSFEFSMFAEPAWVAA